MYHLMDQNIVNFRRGEFRMIIYDYEICQFPNTVHGNPFSLKEPHIRFYPRAHGKYHGTKPSGFPYTGLRDSCEPICVTLGEILCIEFHNNIHEDGMTTLMNYQDIKEYLQNNL